MTFAFRLGILLGIVAVLLWTDVGKFLKAVGKETPPAKVELAPIPEPLPAPPPRKDPREEARREFERLRRENLASADEEARYRSYTNQAVDREDAADREREAAERRRSSSGSSRVSIYSSPSSGGWR